MSMDAKRRLLSFLTVTALCLASVGAPPPAAATIDGSVSVETELTQAGDCSRYRIVFASASALTERDAITLTFPQGTSLNAQALPTDGIMVNDVPVGGKGGSLTPRGNQLTIPIPKGADRDAPVYVVEIGSWSDWTRWACVGNPAVGTYTIKVATSKDPAVTSDPYTISTDWRFKFDEASYAGVPELRYWDLPTLNLTTPPANVSYAATDLTLLNPTRVETVSVRVTSASDPIGLAVKLTETGVHTGIFTGGFRFTTGPTDQSGGYLHVQDGDTLTASGPPKDSSLTATATWRTATNRSIQVWANVEPTQQDADWVQFALLNPDTGAVVSCFWRFPPSSDSPPSWRWCSPMDPAEGWDFLTSNNSLGTQAVSLTLPTERLGKYVLVALKEGFAGITQPFTLPDPTRERPNSFTYVSADEVWATILPPLVLKEDHEPPAPPTVQGGSDLIWSDGRTLKLVGQAESLSDVSLISTEDVAPIYFPWDVVRSNLSGNWTMDVTLGDELPEGSYTAKLSAVDLAGNASAPRIVQIIVDRTALPPSVDSVFTDSTSVTGLAEPGAQIRITRDGKLLGTGTADNSGHFQVAIARQLGHARLEVRQTDRVGNVSEPTMVEVQFPRVPVPTVFQVRPGDKEITGVTQPGLNVEVYKGGTLLGQTRGTADGRWGVAIPAQREGAQLQVRVTDPLDPANAPALVYIAVTAKQSNTPAGPPPVVVPPVSGSSTGSSTTVTTTTGQEGATPPSPGGSGSSHRPPPPPPKPKGDGVELLPDGRTRLTKMLTVGDRPEAMVADLRGALVDQCQVILPIPLLQKSAAVGGTLRLLTDGGSLTISARSLVQAAGEQKLIALTLDRVRPTLPSGGPSAAGPALFIQVKDGYGRPIAIGALADPATLTLGSEGAGAGAVWHWVEASGAWIPLTAPLAHGTILLTKLGFFLPVKP